VRERERERERESFSRQKPDFPRSPHSLCTVLTNNNEDGILTVMNPHHSQQAPPPPSPADPTTAVDGSVVRQEGPVDALLEGTDDLRASACVCVSPPRFTSAVVLSTLITHCQLQPPTSTRHDAYLLHSVRRMDAEAGKSRPVLARAVLPVHVRPSARVLGGAVSSHQGDPAPDGAGRP
jgi:hypothetical protein